MASSSTGPHRRQYVSLGSYCISAVGHAYHIIDIKSPAMAVKIANVDISIVMRISLNGTRKWSLAILPRCGLYAISRDLILIIRTARIAQGTVANVLSCCLLKRRVTLVRKTPSFWGIQASSSRMSFSETVESCQYRAGIYFRR